MKKLVLVASLVIPLSLGRATTYTATGPTQSEVAAVLGQPGLTDGDTVIVPRATGIHWTKGITINKYITLQGATHVTGAGTETPASDDTTNIIKDFKGPLISTKLSPTGGGSHVCRITGLTIT